MPDKTTTKVWSDVEKEAMKESARERKAQAKLSPEEERAVGEAEVQAKIAEMIPAERAMAEKIHSIVARVAADLVPRTYYGMPAYATPGKNGKTILFFQPAQKFKVRYSTLGFQPDAKLDDGNMWPTSWALTKIGATEEKKIEDLIKKAVE